MAVVALIQRAPNGSIDADALRRLMLACGYGKHPAAVAMHLTRLSWKNDLVTSWCPTDGRARTFALTRKGAALPKQPLPSRKGTP